MISSYLCNLAASLLIGIVLCVPSALRKCVGQVSHHVVLGREKESTHLLNYIFLKATSCSFGRLHLIHFRVDFECMSLFRGGDIFHLLSVFFDRTLNPSVFWSRVVGQRGMCCMQLPLLYLFNPRISFDEFFHGDASKLCRSCHPRIKVDAT